MPVGPPHAPLGNSGVALELEDPEDVDARDAQAGLELAHDRFDVVAVRVEHECGVVAAGIVRAVLLADTWAAVVASAASSPARWNASTWARVDATKAAWIGPPGSPSKTTRFANCAPRSLSPERWDLELREHGPVEGDARPPIANRQLDMVENDARPVPVDGHGGDRTKRR